MLIEKRYLHGTSCYRFESVYRLPYTPYEYMITTSLQSAYRSHTYFKWLKCPRSFVFADDFIHNPHPFAFSSLLLEFNQHHPSTGLGNGLSLITQAITWTDVYKFLCCHTHMASPGHNQSTTKRTRCVSSLRLFLINTANVPYRMDEGHTQGAGPAWTSLSECKLTDSFH